MDYGITSQALAVCIADNDAVLLWGPPGHGKTTVVTTIAQTYGLHLEVVIASIRDPSDFSGIPYAVDGSAQFIPPRWAKDVVDAWEGKRQQSIVMYDEISTAAPSLQAALLRPILEKVAGDLPLPSQTRSVGTANPPDIAADGWELSPPMANRFVHLDWELDAKTVKEGFTWGFPEIAMPSFPRQMKAIRRQSKALVGIFLSTRPELVSHLSKDFGVSTSRSFSASDYAFPTPRSWETAARIHAACTAARLPDGSALHSAVLPLLLKGTIGVAATTEFMAYMTALDLPDPEALLSRQIAVTVPKRGDQVEALLSSVNTAYLSQAESVERWNAYGDILSTMVDSGKADAAYKYILAWSAQRPHGCVPTGNHVRALSGILNELS